MLRLRVTEILKEKGMTKYQLHKAMMMRSGISYGNFNALVENKTKAVKYQNLELLSDILEVGIGELFEKVDPPADSASEAELDPDTASEAEQSGPSGRVPCD